jgi:serine/threonine protein kinase
LVLTLILQVSDHPSLTLFFSYIIFLLQDETDDTSIKIADFGFAKKVSGVNSLSTLCGTAQYVAPEILDFQVDGYDERCDMWSVGVVTYILLGGYAPFEGPPDELAQFIIRGDYEFHDKYWSEISEPAKDMISGMLQVDPELRLTAEDSLHCEWMALDAEELASKDLSGTRTAMTNMRKALPDEKNVEKAFGALLGGNKFLSLGAMMNSLDQHPGKGPGGVREDTEFEFEDVYDWGKQIGIGTFSVIHRCVHIESEAIYAVKRVPRNDLWEEDAVALQDEINCLKVVVDHPNIVRLHKVFDEADFTFLVLEQLPGGYLIDKIIEKEAYEEAEAREVAKRLIAGLAYCHEKRIAIRDLKPESMLLVSVDNVCCSGLCLFCI